MKLFSIAALVAALAVPVAVSAQQAQPPAATAPANGQTNQKIYKRWSRMLNGVNLSQQQHDQIQGLLDQYAQAHPAGSARDPQGVHQLRNQIFATLTSDQQAQVRQTVQQMRQQAARRRQQRQQRQQQPQYQQPQYQQPQYQQPQPGATP